MAGTAILEHPAGPDSDESGKRQQIIDGARHVFLDRGFDGASMNEIARVAGVSKGTLYVYFDSKERLFEELIRQEKRQQAEQIIRPDEHLDDDLRAALIDLGTRLMMHILEPSRIAQLRTVIGVSAKFPRVGQAFYEAGPLYGITRMAAFLEERAGRDGLVVEDFTTAAEHFMELCKSRHVLRAILGVDGVPSERTVHAHVVTGVDVFLRAYQPR